MGLGRNASTVEEAEKLICPMTLMRTNGDGATACHGSACAAWRWHLLPRTVVRGHVDVGFDGTPATIEAAKEAFAGSPEMAARAPYITLFEVRKVEVRGPGYAVVLATIARDPMATGYCGMAGYRGMAGSL